MPNRSRMREWTRLLLSWVLPGALAISGHAQAAPAAAIEFTTEKAGVPGTGYGLGCVWGDYDNDGFPDLFVTQYGRNILYHNNVNGTFTDVTDKAGVAGME